MKAERLFIAEKPALGKVIAEALGRRRKVSQGKRL
jgi:DNA topoisomerase IA